MTRYHFWILAGLLVASGAQAQSNQAQLVRPSGANDLSTHLARLAANPRDITALIGAGEAALELDDPRAATGFFARAEAIDGRNGRVKAGLARVMLQMRNPAEALRLFDQATALGFPEKGILSDRGVARDMVGDQAGAQRDYQAALKTMPDDAELIRRYAASLGISGQVEASDGVLEPLLYKSDRAAWRYRAFILAMNNRQADAKKIADQTLPAQLATALTPYLQKMPYLTAAQKAAAVHLGHFPATVGTTIAAVTPTAPAASPPAAAAPAQTAAATPSSATTDRRAGRGREQRATRRATTLAQAETQRPQTASAPAAAAPPPAQSAPSAAAAPSPPMAAQPSRAAMVPPLPARPAPVAQAARPSAVQGPPAPGFETMESARAPAAPPSPPAAPSTAAQLNAITLAQATARTATAPAASVPTAPAASAAPASPPAAPPRPQPDMEAARTLADIIRAIDVPESERRPTVAAVDLAEVAAMQAERRAERQAAAAKAAADAKAVADKAKAAAAAKAKAEADAKAKKEAEEKRILAANPSRSWLQIGIGANRAALPFTLKTVRGKYADIAAQQAWSASWGRTNRLLVGPFPNFARAKALEDKLKAQGADVFAWQSSAGEVVERLAGQ